MAQILIVEDEQRIAAFIEKGRIRKKSKKRKCPLIHLLLLAPSPKEENSPRLKINKALKV